MTKEELESVKEDRREYFRIDDSIQVSYRVIDPQELPENLDDRRMRDGRFTIMTRLQSISQHLYAHLHRIEQRDPDVAEYLRALDEKIDLLGRSFFCEEREILDRPSLSVNLSAGGMAMDVAKPLTLGTLVEIKLLLLPSYTGVIAYGEVVGVASSTQDDESFPHHVHVNFTLIRSSDREALIRHIMRRQGEMLRQRKRQQDQE